MDVAIFHRSNTLSESTVTDNAGSTVVMKGSIVKEVQKVRDHNEENLHAALSRKSAEWQDGGAVNTKGDNHVTAANRLSLPVGRARKSREKRSQTLAEDSRIPTRQRGLLQCSTHNETTKSRSV